jgi:hypothetical protein
VKDQDQLTYYNSGIGTYVRDSRTSLGYWLQAIDHTIDMAIAWYGVSVLQYGCNDDPSQELQEKRPRGLSMDLRELSAGR